eukprot:6414309-Prymnesium_polylepis.1
MPPDVRAARHSPFGTDDVDLPVGKYVRDVRCLASLLGLQSTRPPSMESDVSGIGVMRREKEEHALRVAAATHAAREAAANAALASAEQELARTCYDV